jgi:hypothetical protein
MSVFIFCAKRLKTGFIVTHKISADLRKLPEIISSKFTDPHH